MQSSASSSPMPSQALSGAAAQNSSQAFTDALMRTLPLIEEALHEACSNLSAPAGAQSDVSGINEQLTGYLYEPLAHFVRGGGKRVRPALALIAAEAVSAAAGRPKAQRPLSLAVALEYFQAAALIHDDIADEGELRRGEPCTYLTHGTGLAINMGDEALVDIVELISSDTTIEPLVRLELLRELTQMERLTLAGQALDLGWARDERWDLDPAAYLHMATLKTAYYTCAYPLKLGALAGLGARPQDLSDELAAFPNQLFEIGVKMGLAFQLQDDVLNLVGSAQKQGKDFRTDIAEGKRTYIALTALKNLPENQARELRGVLGKKDATEAELAHATDLMETSIRTTQELAQDFARAAILQVKSLSTLSDEARACLVSLAHFVVDRLA